MGMLAELRRRKVFRVGAAYLVGAWIAVQAASIGFPAFEAPDWVLRAFILVLLLGFPLAIVLAWALEVTPDGVRVEGAGVGGRRVFALAGVLAVLAVAWYFRGQMAVREADDGPRTLAVLPFTALGADAESSGLAGGLHDTLITQLSKLKGLEVRSRTSVMKYKDATGGLKTIASELGVGTVLEGSVQRQGTRTVVNAQLIDARTDAHLWAETIDRSSDDLFALQAEIAQRVTDGLRITLSPDERRALNESPTQDREAYALHVQAQRVLGDAEGLESGHQKDAERRHAASLLEAAVARDPGFALAWAQLARAYATIAWDTQSDDYRAFADKAREAARRTATLGSDLPEAHFVRGSVALQLDFDFPLAVRELEQAVAQAPSVPFFHSRLSLAYRYNGQLDKSERSGCKAFELEPESLDNAITCYNALMRLRKLEQAAALTRRVAVLWPKDYSAAAMPARVESYIKADAAPLLRFVAEAPGHFAPAPQMSSDAYLAAIMAGDYAAALAAIDSTPAHQHPDLAQVMRADALRLLGRTDEARAEFSAERERILSRLALELDPYVEALSRATLAYVQARLGEVQAARDNIARADALWGMRREPTDGSRLWAALLPAHIALGERGAAIEKIRELLSASTEFTAGRLWLNHYLLDLHSDPGFRALMQQHGVDVAREPFASNRERAGQVAPAGKP